MHFVEITKHVTAAGLFYLDPGSGSFILQIILASLLSAGVLIRVFWKKIAGLFGRTSREEEAESTQENPGREN